MSNWQQFPIPRFVKRNKKNRRLFFVSKKRPSHYRLFTKNLVWTPRHQFVNGAVPLPLIFVHVGKSGGGSVRARFAASALNYTRGQKWADSKDRNAYYAIPSATDLQSNANATIVEDRGYFCSSRLKRFSLFNNTKSFEGRNLPCAATTPLGQAVACPGPSNHFNNCGGCKVTDSTCHRIYAGHNRYGNEIHWLPPAYLTQWMNNTTVNLSVELKQFLQSIHPQSQEWCELYNRKRPKSRTEYHAMYQNCSLPLAKRVDAAAQGWIRQQQQQLGQDSALSTSLHADLADLWNHPVLPEMDHSINWGPLYASLPVLRTTVIREPFSWILSKFYWHKMNTMHQCKNVSAAAFHEETKHIASIVDVGSDIAPGWAHRLALSLILHLCGEDCIARWEHATSVLGAKGFTPQHEKVLVQSFVRQADYNLRHGMAVVGLNEDIKAFYDMVTTRVSYVDMSRNPHVHGSAHPSSATHDCKRHYQTIEFQQSLLQASSTIRAIVGLYDTAKRVNAFQKNEMLSCLSGETAGAPVDTV
eukprot:scaffold5479_cov199-Amphora_coffeaeformis.AAC.37